MARLTRSAMEESSSFLVTGNTIGGTTPGARNLISGNIGDGVGLGGQANNNVVQGNFIGTNVTGRSALGHSQRGVTSTGFNLIPPISTANLIGGNTVAARNIISGNNRGIELDGASDMVQGNFIGTDLTGICRCAQSKFGGDGVADVNS